MASNPTLILELAEELLSIHRLPADQPLPATLSELPWVSFTRTADEVSIVAPADFDVPSERRETGWRRLTVRGPLDFDNTGILAGLSVPLAAAGVAIFVISTFDTDHLLVRDSQVALARRALEEAGYLWRT